MTPYRAWQLSQPLAMLYEGIEDDILTSIANRLAKNLEITDTSKWEIKMLAQLGALRKDTARIIVQRAGIAPELLQTAMETAAAETLNRMEPGLRELAKEGYAKNTRVQPKSTVRRAVRAYWKQSADSLNMVNTVMQYKVKPAWVNLIKGIRGYIEQDLDRQATLDVLNKHTGATIIGAETRQQAVRRAINELLDNGIPAFVDKAGREWSPEAYVNMDIRTTVTNTAHQAQDERMDDYGLDLFQVSSHSGARPKCAKDQGKIFSRKNKSGYTTDLNSRRVRFYPQSSSSIGEPDGLFGINCGHFKLPFVPGLSMQRYFPTEDVAENDRLYQQSQQQRALERKIRRAKQECMVYDALGDKEAFRKASAALKASRDTLNSFTKATGRTRRTDREQVVGFDRSLSSKATAAARKAAQREEYIKKIKPTLPKTKNSDNTILAQTLPYEVYINGKKQKGVIPSGSELGRVRIIAGLDTSSELRISEKLAQKHGGDDWKWQKKGGIIESKYHTYDVHWYEYDGKQFEAKLKGAKKK